MKSGGKSKGINYINKLPPEVLLKICSYLDIYDALRCRLVSTTFKTALDYKSFWFPYLLRSSNLDSEKIKLLCDKIKDGEVKEITKIACNHGKYFHNNFIINGCGELHMEIDNLKSSLQMLNLGMDLIYNNNDNRIVIMQS